MKRAIVNVATGRYVLGQRRLFDCGWLDGVGLTNNDEACFENPENHCFFWSNKMPPGSPAHQQIPFAFKAWALQAAADAGFTTLLWADSCILPVQPLDSLFEKIERDGYWISANGFSNAEWTVPEAYADLDVTPKENEGIEHVVATTFGLDLTHPIGRRILGGYLRLAQTKAFCGPVRLLQGTRSTRGDMQISGHRHDQSALSVLAHRAGCVLTNAPEWFSYRGGEIDSTVLVADGSY